MQTVPAKTVSVVWNSRKDQALKALTMNIKYMNKNIILPSFIFSNITSNIKNPINMKNLCARLPKILMNSSGESVYSIMLIQGTISFSRLRYKNKSEKILIT